MVAEATICVARACSSVLHGPPSALAEAREAGFADEKRPRQAREAPRQKVAGVRVADRRDDEEDDGGDQKQRAQSKVHRGAPFGWHDLYARLASTTNRGAIGSEVLPVWMW
jgi:hypothetical protein